MGGSWRRAGRAHRLSSRHESCTNSPSRLHEPLPRTRAPQAVLRPAKQGDAEHHGNARPGGAHTRQLRPHPPHRRCRGGAAEQPSGGGAAGEVSGAWPLLLAAADPLIFPSELGMAAINAAETGPRGRPPGGASPTAAPPICAFDSTRALLFAWSHFPGAAHYAPQTAQHLPTSPACPYASPAKTPLPHPAAAALPTRPAHPARPRPLPPAPPPAPFATAGAARCGTKRTCTSGSTAWPSASCPCPFIGRRGRGPSGRARRWRCPRTPPSTRPLAP